MLSDFLTLEVYFGGADSAQNLEEAYERYGREALRRAVMAGDLIVNGPLCWLSDKGREKALEV